LLCVTVSQPDADALCCCLVVSEVGHATCNKQLTKRSQQPEANTSSIKPSEKLSECDYKQQALHSGSYIRGKYSG
jgi:hypothetical protein